MCKSNMFEVELCLVTLLAVQHPTFYFRVMMVYI